MLSLLCWLLKFPSPNLHKNHNSNAAPAWGLLYNLEPIVDTRRRAQRSPFNENVKMRNVHNPFTPSDRDCKPPFAKPVVYRKHVHWGEKYSCDISRRYSSKFDLFQRVKRKKMTENKVKGKKRKITSDRQKSKMYG